MTDAAQTARGHYQAGLQEADAIARILTDIEASDRDRSAVDLGALDQFHAGGVPSTLRLAGLLAPLAGRAVLDAGSGLGGPARVIAERFDCHVTGVDLTPGYVELATRLATITGLSDRVDYLVGDLLLLPFEDGQFDSAYTQHVVMNIADRDRLYAELRRVIRTGGGFAFHDVVAAEGADRPVYPTPWAQSAASSFLLDEDETVAALQRARLRVDSWEDVSNDAAGAIARLREAKTDGPTLGTIMGERFQEMTQNYARNLREGRLRVIMGRATAF